MRRWRSLPFRRGRFAVVPAAAPPARSQPARQRTLRWQRHPQARGRFFPLPPAPAAAVPPSWVAPQLRQPRRLADARRRRAQPAVPAVPGSAAAVLQPRRGIRAARPPRGQFFPLPARSPAGLAAAPGRHPLRLARPPRGQYFPVPPAPVVTGGTGPLIAAHLRQRRQWPPRITRGHRADPPWAGPAAPPPSPPAPQFPRQHPPSPRLPRRGCITSVPVPRQAAAAFQRRAIRPGLTAGRRGCIFRPPVTPAVTGGPGPVVAPFTRPAGSRPRWPARVRRGCWWNAPRTGAPPPPFTIGVLTASAATAQLTAAITAARLTTLAAAPAALTAVTSAGIAASLQTVQDEGYDQVLDQAGGPLA